SAVLWRQLLHLRSRKDRSTLWTGRDLWTELVTIFPRSATAMRPRSYSASQPRAHKGTTMFAASSLSRWEQSLRGLMWAATISPTGNERPHIAHVATILSPNNACRR